MEIMSFKGTINYPCTIKSPTQFYLRPTNKKEIFTNILQARFFDTKSHWTKDGNTIKDSEVSQNKPDSFVDLISRKKLKTKVDFAHSRIIHTIAMVLEIFHEGSIII